LNPLLKSEKEEEVVPGDTCLPIHLNDIPAKLPMKIKICEATIMSYEEHRRSVTFVQSMEYVYAPKLERSVVVCLY
jgi:hypothetical protein